VPSRFARDDTIRLETTLVPKALFLVVSLIAMPLGAASAAADSKVSHFTLANGLEVVVVPDHRAPVITHMIWYKVGAADETPGKSGLAHVL
jgi:zinc protease